MPGRAPPCTRCSQPVRSSATRFIDTCARPARSRCSPSARTPGSPPSRSRTARGDAPGEHHVVGRRARSSPRRAAAARRPRPHPARDVARPGRRRARGGRTHRGARPAACVPPGRRRRRGTRGRRAPRRPTRRTRVPPPTASVRRVGAEGHERHHVERAEARVHARVRAQIELRTATARASARAASLGVRAGQGEHGPVVVGSTWRSSRAGPHAAANASSTRVVASLRHVGHALEHRCRVRRSGATAPVECRRCGSDWRSRSTTTRSRASRRCGGRASSTYARAADAAGYDSLWVSDHLFLDVAKYGGPPDRHGVFDPIVHARRARVAACPVRGSARSCLCEALRPASVLAKSLATPRPRLRRSARRRASAPGGTSPSTRRSGWRCRRPASGSRGCARRSRCCAACSVAVRARSTAASTGRTTRATQPAALQRPTPPIFVGGKGDRLLRLVAELADGWNTCWVWTPDAYRERLEVLDARVRRGRPRPRVGTTVARSLRVVRRGRARPRAALRASAGGHAARRARRRDPRASGARGASWAPSTRCGSRRPAGRTSGSRP